jgi:Rieske Fe-S protein
MEPISRRSLFAGVCAVVALGGSEVPAAANAAVKKLPNGKLSVTLKNLPALSTVGGAMRIGSIKGVPIGIARVGTNKYTAFNLRCPHQGITVSRTESGWMCNAHNSEFEADGDLVLGPATTGLSKVAIKVSRGVATIG